MSFVTAKLTGRLGNNVIQIMNCISYSIKHNIPYYIPPFVKSKYTKQNPFDQFPLLTPELEARIQHEHNDDGWNYTPIPAYPGNVRLHGYYQNLNYFDEYRKEIIEAFNLPKEKIEAVAVHVRRGDFRRYPTKWPVLNDIYYLNAGIECLERLGNKELHIFSDEDIREEHRGAEKYFIAGDPLEDWLRMTQYKYFIIANSTYSWSAAYLSGSENVIAPKAEDWYGVDNKHIYNKDFLPLNWIKI